MTTWKGKYEIVRALLADPRKLVRNGSLYPRWVSNDVFWYERATASDTEFRIVDARSGTNALGFSREAAIAVLEKAMGRSLDRERLQLKNVQIAADARCATFDVFTDAWQLSFADGSVRKTAKTDDPGWAKSPDGKSYIFVREGNLWLTENGRERALTQDGEPFYCYGSPPAATRNLPLAMVAPPQGLWSPDGTHFFTVQTDDRHVPELALMDFVPAAGNRPQVSANRTSLPGDPKVTEFRLISIEVATGRQTEARYPRLTAVRMNDTIFSANLAWWSKDGRTAYFVDLERGERRANVVAFDVATGQCRVVFFEESQASLELSVNVYAPALIRHLPDTSELVWFSERSGRGHLYLYDLKSGALKRPITQGDWQVREVLDVDVGRREVFLLAGGLDPADPYLRRPCVASLDRDELRVVSAEPGDHTVWRRGEFSLMVLRTDSADPLQVSGLSPGGDWFVETVGGVDCLPRSVLRRRSGDEVMVLEDAENAGLPAGWQWPEPVKLKAADGKTDLYGLLFKPHGFDPAQKYPLINHVYGGPQVSWVPKSAFTDFMSTNIVLETAAYASLGAFALVLDGRGTANRERDFRLTSYRAVHEASCLDDHVAGIEQLAVRYPAIDLARVGITGFSGGGYLTAMAALRRGDFFKVAVAGAGNYDQGLFWHTWGERYHGEYEAEHYKKQATKSYAAGLRGKLMLIHGLMDSGCHPAALFQLVQALIDEDKDFDLVVLPRAKHEMPGYGVRRRLDYFVTHLFGDTPPARIRFRAFSDEWLAKLAWNATVPTQEN